MGVVVGPGFPQKLASILSIPKYSLANPVTYKILLGQLSSHIKSHFPMKENWEPSGDTQPSDTRFAPDVPQSVVDPFLPVDFESVVNLDEHLDMLLQAVQKTFVLKPNWQEYLKEGA